MGNCQKYFSVISESSQTQCACCRSPTDCQGHTDFPDKEMNEPSQLCHFLEAHEKNESQPHCYGEEKWEDVQREVASAAKSVWGLGSHSLANMYLKTWLYSLSHALLQSSPTGQTARQAGVDIEAQLPKEERRSCFQCLPFISSVPCQQLTTTKHVHHYQVWQPNWRKGILSPSWATLIWTCLTRQGGTCTSPGKEPWRKCTYSFVLHLLNVHSVPGTVLGTGDTRMTKIPKNPCSDGLQKHSPFLNNTHQQWSLNKWNCNKITRNPKIIL